MFKPYSNYVYNDYLCDYETWAKMCLEESVPLLQQVDAVRLERLYADGVHFTNEQHAENIIFLLDLQIKITYVWSYSQRQKARMGNLVGDYKKYYGIEEKAL